MVAKSQRLRLRELRLIGELIGQIKELGSNPFAWRTHALEGLLKLTRGQLGLTLDVEGFLPDSIPRFLDPIDIGWHHDSERIVYFDYLRHEVVDDPGSKMLLEMHAKARFVTASREQVIDDDTWYGAFAVSELRRSARLDDFVSSTVALGPGHLHGFVLYRPWGQERFGARERRCLRLFHVQMIRLYKQGIADLHGPPEVRALPPRVRQTMHLLLAGHSIKQAATIMGVSQHTVTDYTKILHRRLNVSTRAELLQRYLPRPRSSPLRLPDSFPTPAFAAN